MRYRLVPLGKILLFQFTLFPKTGACKLKTDINSIKSLFEIPFLLFILSDANHFFNKKYPDKIRGYLIAEIPSILIKNQFRLFCNVCKFKVVLSTSCQCSIEFRNFLEVVFYHRSIVGASTEYCHQVVSSGIGISNCVKS